MMEEQAPETPTPPAAERASSSDRRRVLDGASAALLIAIVVMVNYLAYRHYDRLDLTSVGMFTLSPKSVEVVRGLSSDVDIYLFLSQGEPAFERTDELLKRYRAISERVHVHYVDPDREPAEFKVLAQRFGVLAGVLETGEARADVAAIVAIGDKNWHVSREDMVGFDFAVPGQKQETVKAQAEMALTGAIVQVTSGRATHVCVTQGHGEWSLGPAGERSLQSLQQGLHHDNIEWEPLATLGLDAIPDTCDAVFVVSPVQAFSAPEAELLGSYLQGGGNLLMALDPVIELDQIKPTGLEGMLQQQGIRLDRALVIEMSQDHLLTPNPIEFVVTAFNAHETTIGLQGRARVFMALARPVSPDGSRDSVTTLLRTSDQAFGETQLAQVVGGQEPTRGADDLAGPVSLAVAAHVGQGGAGDGEDEGAEDAPGGRLIVVGDADFLEGQLIEAPELANFHLAASWTGWLTQRKALIAIPPKPVKGGAIMLTQDDLQALFLRVAVLLPAAALFAGIAAWLTRRA